jgi:hypothetical protein
LECLFRDLIDDAGHVFECLPIQHLSVTTENRSIAQLADCVPLHRLRSLELPNSFLGDQALQTLLDLPSLLHLHHLNLGNGGLNSAPATLAKCPHLAQLRSLILSGNALGDRLRELASGENWPHLQELNLFATAVTGSSVVSLAQSGRFPSLRRLTLSSNFLGDDFLSSLVHSPGFRALEYLNLSRTLLTEAGIAELLRSPALPQLREVVLLGNTLNADFWQTQPHASRQRLHLQINDFPLDRSGAMLQSPVLAASEGLTFQSQAESNNHELIAVFASPVSANLRILNWDGGRWDRQAASEFSSRANLLNLRHLSLAGANWERGAIGEFLAGPLVSRLRVLDLSGKSLDEEAANALINSTQLQKLERLLVTGSRLSEKTFGKLQERFGERVWFL